MRQVAMIGLLVGVCAGSTVAETFTFPHRLEIAGRLVNTPLGSAEIPYQATQGEGNIAITPGVMPPTTFDYGYETTPTFAVDLGGVRMNFALLLMNGRGRCDADAEDPALWRLQMEYIPVALIGGVEYRLPGDGMISFSRPHLDPQPLPVASDDEEARHGTPVVFLIESAITLWADGDDTSESFLVIDSASRIVIEESVPAPASGCLLGVIGAFVFGRRRW